MITLTRADDKEPIWINPDYIQYFHNEDGGYTIMQLKDCRISIDEPPSEIERIIKENKA